MRSEQILNFSLQDLLISDAARIRQDEFHMIFGSEYSETGKRNTEIKERRKIYEMSEVSV